MRKIALLILCCAVSAVLIVRLETRSLDLFFLDWKQILLNRTPPDASIKILDLSNLKWGSRKADEANIIPTAELKKTLDNIFLSNPKVVFMAISTLELEAEKKVCELLIQYPRLYLIDHEISDFNAILLCNKYFKDFNRSIPIQLTRDQSIDSVPRRNIIFFDFQKAEAESSFARMKEVMGQGFPPEHFEYTFKYLNTLQAHLKIWPFFKFGRSYIDSPKDISKLHSELEGKVVIIDTTGIRAFLSAYSMLRRLPWAGLESFDQRFQPIGNVVATFVTHLLTGEYIKEPSISVQAVWIFSGLMLVLGSALFFPVVQAMIASSAFMILFTLLGMAVFSFISFNLDTGKTLVVGVIGQYFILTTRYVRRIRSLDRERFLKQQEFAEERLKHQLLLKAAISESTLRTVGKMSHDIRSPLTALNIAGGLLRGKVSEELRDLIVGASQRIEGISADLLQGYKSKDISVVADTLPLQETLESLLKSYKVVDSAFKFELDVDHSVRIPVPEIIIQRAFSNLINNSMEACRFQNQPCAVFVRAVVREGFVDLFFSDNGPGIPQSLLPRLFLEGATQGKIDGHGLGLFQVKSDLEKWGATVEFVPQAKGATFKIILPLEAVNIKFKVSASVCVISQEESSLETLHRQGFSVTSFTNFSQAKENLANKQLGELTLIADLTPAGSDESGLDFLDSFGQKSPFYKTLFISSLSDNLKIQELLNRRNAVLISRNTLLNIQFVKDDK